MHDVPATLREQLHHRVQSYRGESERLNKEFVSHCITMFGWVLHLCVCVCVRSRVCVQCQKKAQVAVGGGMRSELFGEEMVTSEDHVSFHTTCAW